MIHIRTQFNQAKTQILTPQLASTLLTNCRQELEETAQESVNRDYHQGKEALGKILTEEQKAALEQASLDQGLPEMMEQVIRTEYALGITLPQCQQELHRELRMRHRKDPSPEPSTEDGERKRQGQTDSLTGLPHLVEGMPAEKQKTFRELVGEILELCNP